MTVTGYLLSCLTFVLTVCFVFAVIVPYENATKTYGSYFLILISNDNIVVEVGAGMSTPSDNWVVFFSNRVGFFSNRVGLHNFLDVHVSILRFILGVKFFEKLCVFSTLLSPHAVDRRRLPSA